MDSPKASGYGGKLQKEEDPRQWDADGDPIETQTSQQEQEQHGGTAHWEAAEAGFGSSAEAPSLRSSPPRVLAEQVTDPIEDLYSELGMLMTQAAKEPGLEKLIEHRFAELRQLQREEAAVMRKRFEARLHLLPGTGWAALKKARSLLEAYEDSSSANRTASRRD